MDNLTGLKAQDFEASVIVLPLHHSPLNQNQIKSRGIMRHQEIPTLAEDGTVVLSLPFPSAVWITDVHVPYGLS